MPFAIVMMSGRTSQCSAPNIRPVRPNPVTTSSTMSSAPASLQIDCTRGQYPWCGTLTACRIATGSAIDRRDAVGPELVDRPLERVGAAQRAAVAGRAVAAAAGRRLGDLLEVPARPARSRPGTPARPSRTSPPNVEPWYEPSRESTTVRLVVAAPAVEGAGELERELVGLAAARA